MAKVILIKCDKATTICDKTQYNEASFFDKIKLSIHNFLCHHCKLYSKQNIIMTKLFNANLHKKEQHLCSLDKKELQKALQKEMNNIK